MGLWYECGDGLVKVSWARSDLQCDAYLICPGPSLKNVDANVFNEAGVMTFGINTAYPWIRPDYWFGMDDPSCYSSRVWWEPFIKITRMYLENDVDLTISGGQHIRYCPNVYFPDLENVPPEEMFKRRNHDVSFVWDKNTFIFALHFDMVQ